MNISDTIFLWPKWTSCTFHVQNAQFIIYILLFVIIYSSFDSISLSLPLTQTVAYSSRPDEALVSLSEALV